MRGQDTTGQTDRKGQTGRKGQTDRQTGKDRQADRKDNQRKTLANIEQERGHVIVRHCMATSTLECSTEFSPEHFEHYWEGQECSKSWEIYVCCFPTAFTSHSTHRDIETCNALALEHTSQWHELNTLGALLSAGAHTRWLCVWLSDEACRAKGGRGTRSTPQPVGNYKKSRSETLGTCTDRC